MGLVGRVLRIDPRERRTVALVAGLMFVSLASAAIGESGIYALFFERIGTDALPLMYMAQAGCALVGMFALMAILERTSHRTVYLASPLLLAAVVLAERAVIAADVRWIYPVMWVTVAFATLAQAIGLWGVAGAVVDTRQAKRLFPIFGAGGILGSVAGGLLTRPLASILGAENLLFVWAGGLIVASALCAVSLGVRAGRRAEAPRRRGSLLRDLGGGFSFVRRSRLLTSMAVAAVLFSVLFYSLFLPFANAASERFADPDELAGFFGLVWATITGVAFLVSVLLANRLFSRFGVPAMVLVLPLLYLGAFAIVAVASGFVTVVALRVTSGVWLQGVASPAWETLVNIVPEDRRDQTRTFLNGGPAQVGTALAGLVALVGQDVLSGRQFAAIGFVAALLTLAVVRSIRRAYVEALLDGLLAARPQVFDASSAWTPVPLEIDLQATAVIERAMRSDDVRTRRLAFALAADLRTDVLGDAVLAGREDEDPIVRLAVARTLDATVPAGRTALLEMIDDPDPSVAAAASARSTLSGDPRASARLDRLLGSPDPRERRAALTQLGVAPEAVAADLAERLLTDPDAEVRTAALDTLADTAPDRVLAPAVIGLRDEDPQVRLAAGRALGVSGPEAVQHVVSALRETDLVPAGIEAARRLRIDGRSEPIEGYLDEAAALVARSRRLVGVIPTVDDAEALLRDAILERGRRVARSGLWAASMTTPGREAMQTAIERIDGAPPVRARALETLEAGDAADLIQPLLVLWEPIESRIDDDRGWLHDALDDEDGSIRRYAELVRDRHEGAIMTPRSSPTSLSTIERVLLLRNVPLFADLGPTDLERVAAIAEERTFADGETIATEGELGDDLHVVTEGTIRVVKDGRVLARRSAGDVVGEMSILTSNPKIASLVADGRVATLRIGRAAFVSMIRERPDLALGVIRVLASRLEESANRDPDVPDHG